MQRSAYGRLNATLISHALMTTPTTSFPRRPAAPFPHPRKSNTPPLRHSHEGGNPNPSSVIPAKAGIHTHHPSFPRKPTPSFPRRRESTIPAHAGIQRKHPAKAGIQTNQTPHSHTGPPQRHSRKSGNPHPSSVIPAETYSVIPAKAGIQTHPAETSVIPAKAGIHNSRACGNSTKTPSKPTRHLIPTQDHLNVIPAKAGIHTHHPSFPRKPTPSFPQRRESTIPAQAGIQRKHHPNQPDILIPTQDHLNVIPAKAGIQTHHPSFPPTRLRHSHDGIHNSRARGNSTKTPFPHWGNGTMNSRIPGNDGFPPWREWTECFSRAFPVMGRMTGFPACAGMLWIPAFAGMTDDGVWIPAHAGIRSRFPRE